MTQKTTVINSKYAQDRRRWVLIDAKQAVLGRVASKAANLLRGKNKNFFSPSVDCGDFVIVTNAQNVKLTGEKAITKTYFRHSGYAGGAKVIPFKLQMEKDARKVIEAAVKGMLPATRLRQHQMRRLKIYNGDQHPHAAQKVEAVSV
jgi:large subunit ribosomal protein L13